MRKDPMMFILMNIHGPSSHRTTMTRPARGATNRLSAIS